MKRVLVLSTIVLLVMSIIMGLTGCSSKEAVTLNVSAAASLTDVMEKINSLYTQKNPNVTITPNFASSGTLQQQIQNGAPVDIFISAGETQMDSLQKDQLILNDTRKDLLHNKIVLVVPSDSKIGLSDFNGLLSGNVTKVAIGDPKSVPAGKYAQQAFDQLGLTSQIQAKLILCTDVRQVLTYVENGDVDAGIVYSTDALISDKVKVVADGPAEVNASIAYPVAIIEASKSTDAAREYEDFLFSKEAKTIFEEYGFTTVES